MTSLERAGEGSIAAASACWAAGSIRSAGCVPEALRLDQLVARVRAGGVREVILATNPSMEGEVTATYVQQLLAGAAVKVSPAGAGPPGGQHLEYVDGVTLAHALTARQELR